MLEDEAHQDLQNGLLGGLAVATPTVYGVGPEKIEVFPRESGRAKNCGHVPELIRAQFTQRASHPRLGKSSSALPVAYSHETSEP